MSEITKMFGDQPVRVIQKDGDPWFIAKDVCEILDLSRQQDSTRYLDDDEKGVCLVDTPSGKQEMTSVNESGLYSLIFKSRKPEAKTFRKWVTSEVLPSIRKTGRYSIGENGMQQRNNGTYISLEQLLRTLDANFDHESASYKDCINAILHSALFSSQMNPENAQEIPRLILDAICCGQLVIPGSQAPKPPVSDAENTPTQESDPAPAEEAEQPMHFQSQKLDIPRTAIMNEARVIYKMSSILKIIRRVAIETGRPLTGIPLPAFNTECPLKYNSTRNYINIDELAFRMNVPVETLEENVRKYCSEAPASFKMTFPDFNDIIVPQIKKNKLKYEKHNIMIDHKGLVLLAYLHGRYREIPPSECSTDLTLRKNATDILCKKKKLHPSDPYTYHHKSLYELDKILEPFGGYAKIIDDDWKDFFTSYNGDKE